MLEEEDADIDNIVTEIEKDMTDMSQYEIYKRYANIPI